MSAFTGPQHKGAMQEHRARKRMDAERRNAITPPERTRQYRLTALPVLKALVGAQP